MFNKSVNFMKRPSRENFCFSNQILFNLVATLAVWKLLKIIIEVMQNFISISQKLYLPGLNKA